MNGRNDKQSIALMILIASLAFFIMGFMFPLLETGYGIGPIRLKTDLIYLSTSFRFFFDQGELFIGLLLLFFTITETPGKGILSAELITVPVMVRILSRASDWQTVPTIRAMDRIKYFIRMF